MFTELLLVSMLAGAAFLIPFLVLRAMKKREDYCGADLKHCFRCGRDCDYYRLDKMSSEIST